MGKLVRAMVIGAGGFVGRKLCRVLTNKGVAVMACSSGTPGGIDLDAGLFSAAVRFPKGLDAVYFLAQSPRYRQMPQQSAHLLAVNCVAAVQAAEAARQAGATRFIYASTGNVYAPSFAPLHEASPLRRDDWYALSKVHAEEGLALYRNSLSVTVARIFGVYGPGQTDKLIPNLMHSIQSGAAIKLAPNPTNAQDNDGLRISLCYIDDVTEIFCRLVAADGPDVINIAGPETLSIRDIAVAIGERMGKTPCFEALPRPRDFDLVADVTNLVETFKPEFTPFVNGITRTLESWNEDSAFTNLCGR
jgi:UDP-glucose 4-epimerase